MVGTALRLRRSAFAHPTRLHRRADKFARGVPSKCQTVLRLSDLATAGSRSFLASVHSATAHTSVHAATIAQARSRAHVCRMDGNAGYARAPSTIRPIGQNARSLHPHIGSSSADAGNAARGQARACGDKPSPARGRSAWAGCSTDRMTILCAAKSSLFQTGTQAKL